MKGYMLEDLGILKHMHFSRWFLEIFCGIVYSNAYRLIYPMGVQVR